jgi:hypothetical protein
MLETVRIGGAPTALVLSTSRRSQDELSKVVLSPS